MRTLIRLSIIAWCLFFVVAVPGVQLLAVEPGRPVAVVTEFLLGGWLAGKWVDAETMARTVVASQSFKVYSSSGQLPDQEGGVPCQETGPGEYWNINFAGAADGEQELLKISSDRNGMPRKAVFQTGGLKTYEELVATCLKKNKITAKPQIQQLVRVDLDGNGSEEVIVVAGNADAAVPVFVADTYTLVLFRRIINGKVETTVLSENYYREAREGEADSPIGFKFFNAVDINGDGTLELILKGRYYEGFWYEIYEFKNNKLKKVLSDGLGA